MAILSQTERDRITRWIQRDPNVGDASYVKSELATAVAAADQWADDNAAAYNAALPSAFRTKATANQKALLLVYAICRRAGFTIRDGGD